MEIILSPETTEGKLSAAQTENDQAIATTSPNSRQTQSQIAQFLEALGYRSGDPVFLRLLPPKDFWDKKLDQSTKDAQAALFPKLVYQKGGQQRKCGGQSLKLVGNRLYKKYGDYKPVNANPTQWLLEQNAVGWCPYVVVNPGGQEKDDITGARVFFWESDHKPKEDQLAQFAECSNRWGGAFAIETANSIHCYVRLDQELPPELIDPTLLRVIAHLDTDPSIHDPSRLMRLPGFDHLKMIGAEVVRTPISVIQEWDGSFARWEQIDKELPPLEQAIATIDQRRAERKAQREAQQQAQQQGKGQSAKTPAKSAAKPAVNLSSGGGDLQAFLESEVYPRLGPEQIFNDPSHNWRPKGTSGRLEGGCFAHESRSGTAAYCDRTSDGATWRYNCSSCYPEALNPVAYRHALGGGSGQPTGKDFVEIVRGLAADAGVAMPNRRAGEGDPAVGGTAPSESAWPCLATHNHQLGSWTHVQVPISEADEIERYHRQEERDGSARSLGTRKARGEIVEVFSVFTPKTNFDLEVTSLLRDSKGSALELRIRYLDGIRLQERTVTLRFEDQVDLKRLKVALSKAGPLFIKASLDQLTSVLQNRRARYIKGGGQEYRLVERVGCQDDGYWVFKDQQFDPTGKPCDRSVSGYVWSDHFWAAEQIPSPEIPEQSEIALKKFAEIIQKASSQELLPYVWIVMGWFTMLFQRNRIVAVYRRFPQLAIFGEPGGGKTTLLALGCSLTGMHLHPIEDITTSALAERASLQGCLPLFLDDPLKKDRGPKALAQLEAALWSFCGGGGRVVRAHAQVPNTAACVASNPAIGDGGGGAAVEARLLKIFLPRIKKKPGSNNRDLSQAMAIAAGGIGQLIGIGFSSDSEAEVEQLAATLTASLKGVDQRLVEGWALAIHFTNKFCELAGVEFDALAFVIETICPTILDLGTQKSDLQDFAEKVLELVATDEIGPWNLNRKSTRTDGETAFLWLPSIWTAFKKRFPQVNYSQQTIENLLKDSGAQRKDYPCKNFVRDRQIWLDYKRARDEYDRRPQTSEIEFPPPIEPQANTGQRCFVIPASVWDGLTSPPTSVDSDAGGEANPVEAGGEAETQAEPKTVRPVRFRKSQLEAGDCVTLTTSPEQAAVYPNLQAGQILTIYDVAAHDGRRLYRCWAAVGGDRQQVAVWADHVTAYIETEAA